MSKDESCCPICELVQKYTSFIKSCENDDELEWRVRQIVEKSFDAGYRTFLVETIEENTEFLKYLLEQDELEQDKPNLRVVDNVNTNKH